MARLFVSHAAKDEALVEEFVELLQVGVGIHPDDVFCSSLPGMGIPTGKDFVEHIKSKLQSPELVLLVLSPAFFESQFCHNEVGASWALSLPVYPILVPPISYSDVRGVLAGKQAAKLDDKEKLNDLRDDLSELLKITPLRTSHWERKRDRFLAKLPNLLSGAAGKTQAAEARSSSAISGLVTSSDHWLKLDERFYEAHKVHRPSKQTISLEIHSRSAEEEAALELLRPPHHGRGKVVGFAYQNDGGQVRIDTLSSTSQGGRNLWVAELSMVEEQSSQAFMDMSVQGHSADEIAELRAGRLLVNKPPPPKSSRRSAGHDTLVESAICGWNDAAVQADECVVASIMRKFEKTPELALRFGRLEAVYRLKATGTVQSILELALGPITGKKLHVKFRGQRPRRGGNVEPEVITIDDDCDLG
ncbi:MAG TPA: toll/interleukin-1 receptor domain-containing protein [Pirellulales bacterium]|nr:toll/interleukin-1 receptor domain-containing protein [Pirellulales bacterium]